MFEPPVQELIRLPPTGTYVWKLPYEAPGTLCEIFATEDSRRQNLVLYAFRKVDGFRRCWEAIGKPGDPYDLIGAVMTCISWHLGPLPRRADYRRQLRLTAKRAESAAVALEALSSVIGMNRDGWLLRLKNASLPDPTDPKTIEDLRNMASGLQRMLERGAFEDRGSRPKMMAFRQLIQSLARIFADVTGHRAAVTYDPYRQGYGGKFWDFVEIVRPIAAELIATSGRPIAQPATDLARGKFIERTLAAAAMDKTPAV